MFANILDEAIDNDLMERSSGRYLTALDGQYLTVPSHDSSADERAAKIRRYIND